jgi:hypothetical protein
VRELEELPITDIERIVLYQKYDVDKNLLLPCYSALCAREAPLNLAEGMKLGLETALMIARARECARSKPTGSGERSPTPVDLNEQDMHGIIRDLFNIPKPADSLKGEGPSAGVNGTQSPTGGSVMRTHISATSEFDSSLFVAGQPVSPKANGSSTTPNGAGSPTSDPEGVLGGNANGTGGKDGATNGTGRKGRNSKGT